MHKIVALSLLLTLALSSLLFSPLCLALSKPSVPEFTLKLAAYPYDVAPTTTVDPYTGQTHVKDDGYHQENKSINIIINNQPFNSYVDTNGHSIGLFYNISAKGRFEDSWHYVDNPYWGTLNASNSDYTIISLNYGNDPRYPTGGFPLEGLVSLGDYKHGQIDFRVQALIGYYVAYGGYYASNYVFDGETSGWSGTQTITIGDGNVVTTQPTASPTVTPTSLATESPTATSIRPSTHDALFGLSSWQIATFTLSVVVVLLVFLVFYLHRRRIDDKSVKEISA